MHSDFNGDGFADLAIGVPGEGELSAGALNVLYGSSGGLSARGNQLWSQDSPDVEDQMEGGDVFSFALADGDFNGDGFADLAVGVPFEDANEFDAGAVNVLYGSVEGLSADGNQFWTQDSPGIVDQEEEADEFGYSLSTGDFNGDGFADLAVGVWFEDANASDAGAVNVLYGSAERSLCRRQTQFWSQDSPRIKDQAEVADLFGFSLAVGDFDGDGFGDLAAGVIFEAAGSVPQAGAANVLSGSPEGLSATGDQFWTQDTFAIEDKAQDGDQFGSSLGAGDFDGDGLADLAAGVDREDVEDVGRAKDAGAVSVLYGSLEGLSRKDQFWTQARAGVMEQAEQNDTFGFALSG